MPNYMAIEQQDDRTCPSSSTATHQFSSHDRVIGTHRQAPDQVGHGRHRKVQEEQLQGRQLCRHPPFASKATHDKTAFVKQWNVLAHKYGYTSYSPSQI